MEIPEVVVRMKATETKPISELLKIPEGSHFLSPSEYLKLVAEYVGQKYATRIRRARNKQDRAGGIRYFFQIEQITELVHTDRYRYSGATKLVGFAVVIRDNANKVKRKDVMISKIDRIDEVLAEMVEEFEKLSEKHYQEQMLELQREKSVDKFVGNLKLDLKRPYSGHYPGLKGTLGNNPLELWFSYDKDGKETMSIHLRDADREQMKKIVRALRS